MSMKSEDVLSVPGETARIARLAFPKSNPYMTMRDKLGPIYRCEDFADLFGTLGPVAESPGMLALVVVMQFGEGLSDRQAADAVRGRIDWKYALGLSLDDPGFDYSVLSEFRARLVTGGATRRLLDRLLETLAAEGLIKTRGTQRTDSTHVLAAVRDLNRLELVGETMRHALESLVVVAPDFLAEQLETAWIDRYERIGMQRLPQSEAKRRQLAEVIGADGYRLLAAIAAPHAPAYVRAIPAVRTLGWVWLQQYMRQDDQVIWRTADDLPPGARMIRSPFDPEARFSCKRDTTWMGYKAHLTETCDPELPHLITHALTTSATKPDVTAIPTVHADLAARDRLPCQHVVDTGYMSADNLVASRTDHQVDLVGPVAPDSAWQARTVDAFDQTHFKVSWDARNVTCPAGKTSHIWSESRDSYRHPIIHVAFPKDDCLACPLKARCTQAPQRGRRLKLRFEPAYRALVAARQRQSTEAFKETYRQRAGVEGTISDATGPRAMRRTRYIGYAKVDLQHQATAAAINLLRCAAWFQGRPLAPTRFSTLRRFAAAAA